MSDNSQEPLFFESLEDALKHIVQRAGGSGKVGPELWPGKNGRAPRHLADCLNRGEAEKLSLDELLWLLRKGRELGCHAAMRYICNDAGYRDPEPVEPANEMAELQRATIDAVKHFEGLVQRAERVFKTGMRSKT